MTRLLLTWIGFAILQLGAPRGTSAAELPGGESTRVLPQLELLSNSVLARDASRSNDLRLVPVPPSVPGGPAGLSLIARREHASPRGPRLSLPASLQVFLPEARAPPA